MKKPAIITSALLIFIATSAAFALERKTIDKVSTDEFIKDTQITSPGGPGQMNLIWWIPFEFWESIYANDKNTSEADKEKTMKVLKPYSLVAICQAEISDFGAFKFYSKEEILNRLNITLEDANGNTCKLIPLKDVDPDINVLLAMFKPIFSAAAGNMGENFHFYVLKDYEPNDKRIVDPYRFGKIKFQLGKRSGGILEARLDLPLNSLYVPRICPNGKPAHVSWKYCPWTGKKFEE